MAESSGGARRRPERQQDQATARGGADERAAGGSPKAPCGRQATGRTPGARRPTGRVETCVGGRARRCAGDRPPCRPEVQGDRAPTRHGRTASRSDGERRSAGAEGAQTVTPRRPRRRAGPQAPRVQPHTAARDSDGAGGAEAEGPARGGRRGGPRGTSSRATRTQPPPTPSRAATRLARSAGRWSSTQAAQGRARADHTRVAMARVAPPHRAGERRARVQRSSGNLGSGRPDARGPCAEQPIQVLDRPLPDLRASG